MHSPLAILVVAVLCLACCFLYQHSLFEHSLSLSTTYWAYIHLKWTTAIYRCWWWNLAKSIYYILECSSNYLFLKLTLSRRRANTKELYKIKWQNNIDICQGFHGGYSCCWSQKCMYSFLSCIKIYPAISYICIKVSPMLYYADSSYECQV